MENAKLFFTRSSVLHSSLAVPTAELVKRVKELYHKRVSDVRFLIPVLTGLKKQEIIAVLPKLIKQSPSVVKEVFNRLLGCFHSKWLKIYLFQSESSSPEFYFSRFCTEWARIYVQAND